MYSVRCNVLIGAICVLYKCLITVLFCAPETNKKPLMFLIAIIGTFGLYPH